MPSIIVHAAVGAVIGRAILGDDFDEWALLAVVTAAIFPDVDMFLEIWFPGAHRTVLHNIWIVVIPALIMFYLVYVRDTDFFERHWGPEGERVVWTCIFVIAFAHIGLDLVESGVNLFWPVYDQFFFLTGVFVISTETGVEQSFIGEEAEWKLGTVEDRRYMSLIQEPEEPEVVEDKPEDAETVDDPDTVEDPPDTERRMRDVEIVLPVFGNGYELMFTMISFIIIGQNVRDIRRRKTDRWFKLEDPDKR